MGWSVSDVILYGSLTITALIMAADQALKQATDIGQKMEQIFTAPEWGYIRFVPLFLLITAGVTALLRTRKNEPSQSGPQEVVQKTIVSVSGNNILEPPSRDPVSHRQTVTGALTVQVFIFSGDQKWWPQPPTTLRWSKTCTLGNVGSPAGSPYRIVAVMGGQPLPPGIPVDSLPDGVARSQEVQVFRQ